MWVMGFSINLLTLLAMVLAIGMVVDDAIIVLENIHRHIEAGMKPFDAAIKARASWACRDRHDHHPGRGVPADRVHWRHDWHAVRRIRLLLAGAVVSGVIALTLAHDARGCCGLATRGAGTAWKCGWIGNSTGCATGINGGCTAR
jgi:hypothetical protein